MKGTIESSSYLSWAPNEGKAIVSTARNHPSTKKPPKFSRKQSDPTEKPETQPTKPPVVTSLRFRLPARSRVTKEAEHVPNPPAEPAKVSSSETQSDDEVDELKSSSPVKITTPPKKKTHSTTTWDVQITPPPPLDPTLLRKAAQAEVKARQLQAKAKKFLDLAESKKKGVTKASHIESGDGTDSSEDLKIVEHDPPMPDSDVEPEPQKQQKRGSKGKEANDRPTVIAFNVIIPPLMPENPSSRRRIDTATSFDAFQSLVHLVLGCHDVRLKPQISYKISSAPKGSSSIALASKEDWAACIEDVVSAHFRRPKSKQFTPIDLVAVIPEQVATPAKILEWVATPAKIPDSQSERVL
ncbi:hypothetical protein C8R42DRAFT_646438 [Lentinula raphanica]|nr:hypothetical protein C8R42DRAFT_646438 [Lentinula raphanica]